MLGTRPAVAARTFLGRACRYAAIVALDLYVGTLTRYYSGDWENVVERRARANGTAYVKLGHSGDVPPAEEIREDVLRWRAALRERWAARIGSDGDWSEDDAQPYFSDRPGWDGLQTVRLLACCTNAGAAPPKKPLADPSRHPLWSGSSSASARFSQLFVEDLWLPWDFDFTERIESPAGSTIEVGSARALQRQLRTLNAATYRADAATLERWRRGASPGLLTRVFGDSFAPLAQFALAVLIEAADRAAELGLPLRTDY